MASKTLSRRAARALMIEGYGEMPSLKGLEIDSNEYKSVYSRMLNWANAMFDTKELKAFVVVREGLEYAAAEDYEFNAIGAMAHFLNEGEALDPRSIEYYNRRLQEIRTKYKLDEEAIVIEACTRKCNKQSAYYNARNALADMVEENLVRREDDHSVYNFLVVQKGNKYVFKALKEYVQEVIVELTNARDEDSAEYFENVSNETLSSDLAQFKQLQVMISNIEENNKAMRKKPRKRIVSSEKVVKSLNFKKEDNSLNITSINPSTIVGASALLVFNTKSRKLGIYYAKTEMGLTVSGTTIQNFADNSCAKTVRKPMDILPGFRKSTRTKRWDVMFSDIRAKAQTLTGRINGDTLLVKVMSD